MAARPDQLLLATAGLLLAASLALRLASFGVVAFDHDEFAFGLVARDVLHGLLPGAGVFDNKPPGLVYIFSVAEALGGQNVAALRAVGFAAAIATAGLLVATARRLGLGWAAGMTAAALFLVEVCAFGGWASMSELVACPALAWVNLRLSGAALDRRWRSVEAGVVLGLACQITYLAAPAAIATVLAASLLGAPGHRLRPLLGAAAAGGAAVGLVWLPQILDGVWLPYLRGQIAYHSAYRVAAPALGAWLSGLGVPAGLALAPALPGLGARGTARIVLAAQLAGALLAATASNRLFPHYLLLLLPAALGFALHGLASAPPPRARALLAAALVAVMGFALRQALLLRPYLTGPAFETVAAAAIGAETAPRDAIYVFDETAALYFLARRPAASRYVFEAHYLAYDGHIPLIAPRAALAAALARQPRLVVLGHWLPLDFDPAPLVRAAGYRAAATVAKDGRRIDMFVR